MGKGKVSYSSLEVSSKFLPTYEELADDWALNKVLVSKNTSWWIGSISALGLVGIANGWVWLAGIALFIIFWWCAFALNESSEYNYLKQLELDEVKRRKKNE